MASPLAGLPDELAGHQVQQGAPSLILPNGPGYPRIVQAWLWLKKPTWFLDRCSRAYGDVFTSAFRSASTWSTSAALSW
jgi:hypothetical protein